ncbi:hypothetical protein ONZ45_g14288 [Pleurotus djamor]|nr:hypothetical protein ONZ45_g14288 [Pleurotus djamor]
MSLNGLVCQQCKEPLQLDASLVDLAPSAYDMIVASLPPDKSASHPIPASEAEQLAQLPSGSVAVKQAWQHSKNASTNPLIIRTIPPPLPLPSKPPSHIADLVALHARTLPAPSGHVFSPPPSFTMPKYGNDAKISPSTISSCSAVLETPPHIADSTPLHTSTSHAPLGCISPPPPPFIMPKNAHNAKISPSPLPPPRLSPPPPHLTKTTSHITKMMPANAPAKPLKQVVAREGGLDLVGHEEVSKPRSTRASAKAATAAAAAAAAAAQPQPRLTRSSSKPASVVEAEIKGRKPRSTASKAPKKQQGSTKKTKASTQETPKAKKGVTKKKTSADRDTEDKEANANEPDKLTRTAQILKASGASIAPPARTTRPSGISLPPIGGDSSEEDDTSKGEHSDVLLIAGEGEDAGAWTEVGKGGEDNEDAEADEPGEDKGKGREVEGEDEQSDEDLDERNGEDGDEKDNEDEGEGEDEDEKDDEGEGEGEGEGDDDDDDDEAEGEGVEGKGDDEDVVESGDGEDMVVDVDPFATPRKPKAKRMAVSPAVSPTSTRVPKAARRSVSQSTASSLASVPPGSPSPPPDDVVDRQGASRTTGGIFRGQALGNTLNMADLVSDPDASAVSRPSKGRVYITQEGRETFTVRIPWNTKYGPVLKEVNNKFPLTDFAISFKDGDFWELLGPYAKAITEEEPIDWSPDNELWLRVSSISTGPAVIGSSTTAVASAGVAYAPGTLEAAYAEKWKDQTHIMVELAQALGVTYDLTPTANRHTHNLVNLYARWKIANEAPGVALKLLPQYTINTRMARSVTMEKSSQSDYDSWFTRAKDHPALLKYLEGEVNIHHPSQVEIWGMRKPTLSHLKQVIPELDLAKAKAEAKAAKAAKAASEPVASGSGSKTAKGKAKKYPAPESVQAGYVLDIAGMPT